MTSLSSPTDDGEKTNLIINYLPQDMTDEEFENLFKKFGPMKSCKIVRNRTSGYSYGFGFVDFETYDQAIKAIEELNGHELETKKIKVAFARPAGQDIKQANLYIKNVPNEWTQDDVKKVFEPYGNIIQVRVLGNDRGIAFVLYDLRKQAEDALEALNGKTIDGCTKPLEVKFAADKKSEKGGNKNNGSPARPNNSGRRERGHRGGRNQRYDRRDSRRDGRSNNQRSFFDRQNNDDNRGSRGQNQYNAVQYGGGAQYSGGNYNQMNGVGPVRQTANRMQRYAPFVPAHQAIGQPIIPATSMTAQMVPTSAYGFPAQQQMIPFAMVPSQPHIAPQLQPTLNQPGQLTQPNPMAMYAAAPQIPIGYTPIAQNAMNNMYSIASNNMTNAANMQPQLGQAPRSTNNNNNNNNNNSNNNNNNNNGHGHSHNSSHGDDGVTLFVYNLGPDSDESELRSMFSPYGYVVKCNVVRKTPGGETKGFGFVTLKDRDQANLAISGLNGSMRNGKLLQVSLKK